MGSILVLVSVALLRGPLSHMQHMLTKERIPFTVSYLGSMALTLYAALGVSSSVYVCIKLLSLIFIASKNVVDDNFCYYTNHCFTLVRWILYSRWCIYIKIRYILYWRTGCLHFTHLITNTLTHHLFNTTTQKKKKVSPFILGSGFLKC